MAIERRELLAVPIRLAESTQDFEGAVEIRAAAYARHIPNLGQVLRGPSLDDLRPDALLLLAESKLDEGVVGWILRLQHNIDRPLRIEGEIELPMPDEGKRLVEVRRLGVGNGISGRMVMAALFKAAYEICHAAQMSTISFSAPGRRLRPCTERCISMTSWKVARSDCHPDNVPHSVFALPVRDADRRWRTTGYSLYEFAARTEHPDICVNYERVFAVFGIR